MARDVTVDLLIVSQRRMSDEDAGRPRSRRGAKYLLHSLLGAMLESKGRTVPIDGTVNDDWVGQLDRLSRHNDTMRRRRPDRNVKLGAFQALPGTAKSTFARTPLLTRRPDLRPNCPRRHRPPSPLQSRRPLDLTWNPAILEQRTGRVDRIGSRAANLVGLPDVVADALRLDLAVWRAG